MSVKYREFSGLNLPTIEKEILQKWEESNAFEKSIDLREGAEPFVFYEGPPSANGLPGIHHVISRTLKDLVCRYKTMQGFQVKRKGGWDTHGLPVELGVEKELGITKEDIGKKISVEDYNQKCREAVLRYKDKWDEITKKMGYWVDLNDPYITFENNYIETLWWMLKRLYDKGLLYESVSIQPYSPGAGTGLSSHELNQPGTYKNVKDTSVVAMFKAVENEKSKFLFDTVGDQQSAEVFFLAWTTTPWTLPSNLGLTAGPNIDYVLVKTFSPYTHLPVNVILAKALLGKYFKPEGENAGFENYSEGDKLLPWQILAEFKGSDLEGIEYEQLLPYEANSLKNIQSIGDDEAIKPFRVILGDFVTTEDGTGIVHTSPAFGADDYKVGKKYNIGILTMVDRQGKFVDGLGEFSNRFVKNYKDDKSYEDVNVDICVKLKKENRAFKVEKYEHTYPHCWRTDKPILYYPLDAWFIKTTALKDRMVELNKTINWKPKSTGEGRFGNWLENMVDWNLSRSRFWGTPLPVWKTEDGSEQICIGSIEELNSGIRKANEVLGGNVNENYLHEGILDLHKPYVDEIVLVSPTGKPMKRVPDLVDVWFDSGAMPYAQWHYPFENKDLVDGKKTFPADFICEGVDQTRGWFYTLHALGVLLFDNVAYKTVVSNGLVLDKNGNKMSKRLGNVVDPFQTIDKFGADATRWYLITNASPWDNLKFDIGGIQEVQRKFFGTLYNTYQFFSLYSNLDGFAFKEVYIPLEQRSEIDRWILSSLNTLVKTVTESMDDYEPTQAGRAVEEFVDEHLSNWYVRLCRRRFWKGEYEQDKIAAYQTLYECLETVVRLIAPISPFFSDAVFQNLNAVTNRFKVESVHHANFPKSNADAIDIALEERMQLAQDASSLILSIRKKVNIKVRQPLQKVLIPVLNSTMKEQLSKVEDLIKSEVNVKEIEYLTATEGFINKRIKPNFIALGKRLGSKMKTVSAEIGKLSQQDISRFEKEEKFILEVDGEPLILRLADVEISAEDIPGWSVASKGTLTVALDITISNELRKEGEAREFVNRIQNLRKDSGFEVTDRININIVENERLVHSINDYKNYICAEILADSIDFVPEISDGTQIEVNDILLKVSVIKKA
ncbi:isoleucine--tRNA ligase [Segetibacter aerophilus]|uniref:Isoleucine--tRNA ligase n=1 Tax=Segetibacter aerophilus TaxID=670293 RepID=A0A512BBT0_9BACT|nr:isoleucine--tRNA ligase [Segetibacter aerophilus]GEO09431.1 isoleucine--tRNA ligase [Segetibacter aerophilus]